MASPEPPNYSSTMPHPPIPIPIHIIGSGLSGLILSRCLHHLGIPSVIYERASAHSSPKRHNYGMTLHPWAYRPLLKVLGMDETVFKAGVAVDGTIGGFGRLYGNGNGNGSGNGNAGSMWSGSGPGSFRANRASLESLLSQGLDIQWEHTLTSVTLPGPSGKTELKFENGRTVTCETVVGSDGIHSQLRRALLPAGTGSAEQEVKVKVKVLPYVVFNGKRRVARVVYDELFAPYVGDGTILETRRDDRLLQISIDGYGKDKDIDVVNLSYTYSRRAQKNDDALHRPNRALTETTDISSAFYDEIATLTLTDHLPSPFNHIFEDVTQIRNDRVLHWLMRSSHISHSDLQNLAWHGFVMIGDSAHGEPILGGNGGNNAIRDGVELALYVAENGMERGKLGGFVDGRRCLRWSESVRESQGRICDMHVLGDDVVAGTDDVGSGIGALKGKAVL